MIMSTAAPMINVVEISHPLLSRYAMRLGVVTPSTVKYTVATKRRNDTAVHAWPT